MTLSRQFLHRYTRIQKGVQEQAELELAQAMLARAEAERSLRASVETRESAQEVRNRCNSVADLQQWHQYVQALDIHVQASRTGVVDATATEASHRDAVAVAYREAKRWEMLADGSQRAYQEELRRVGQLEADEFASQRFGRGLR